jgi:hypothetical protein
MTMHDTAIVTRHAVLALVTSVILEELSAITNVLLNVGHEDRRIVDVRD